jgi:phosphoenolpyruvate synthase/pyruvate phosphate dikinase
VELGKLPVDSVEARALAVRRFGAKGTNLAWLRQNLATELTPTGFVIPMHFYDAFLDATRWEVDLGKGKVPHTLRETLTAWLADKTFMSDAKLRRERLKDLQDAFEQGTCDDATMTALAAKVTEVFGKPTEMVRMRSSSNAEDGAFFNGAGLYDSFSGCLADDMDHDDKGPSLCDPEKKDERGLCSAMKKVWASLWNMKAFEERAFYGIDQHQVTMGVLVNARSEAEKANLVAFTGNPVQAGDNRYLVNAQVDEIPVVSPDPGVWPEQSLLTITNGKVSKIERAGASSELPEGEHVLSDAQLTELGAHLAEVAKLYPFDQTPPKGRAFILDMEWKVMPDGALRVKQVRPFLK